MGAGACLALSGIDMALWDIRGKALKIPLYKLLGGRSRPIPAYAGGVSLGYQDPGSLAEEARPHVQAGYKAIKLRIGDTVARDLARVAMVRKTFGDELVILTDANTNYTVADTRAAMPALDELDVGWLEEPFPAHDYLSYREAARHGRLPLAAGAKQFQRLAINRLNAHGATPLLPTGPPRTGGTPSALPSPCARVGLKV